MRPTATITRQVLYAAALTTGIALMGMLAGCAQPQSKLSAPGFPHASRRYVPSPEPTLERVSTGWSESRPAVKKVAPEVLLEAKLLQPPPVEP